VILQLKKYVFNGRFNDFITMFFSLEKDARILVFNKICDELAYEGNICGYGSSCYLNIFNRDANIYLQNAVMMSIYFPYLKGSSYVNFAYLRAASELEPNKEEFHTWIFGEETLSNEEIYKFSKKILTKWPNNFMAKSFISTYEKSPQNTLGPQIKFEVLNAKDDFKNFVTHGRYIETREILSTLTFQEIKQLLVEIAEKERNICSYDYLWFLMREQGESSAKHVLASQIANYVFKYDNDSFLEDLPGLKELIFFHTYRAAELEPENIELQEKLLNLYELENESFDVAEIKALAERVLTIKPESEPAKLVLSLIL
jgi:hypothetical protein